MPAKTKKKPVDPAVTIARLEAEVQRITAVNREQLVENTRMGDERDGLLALIAIAEDAGTFDPRKDGR